MGIDELVQASAQRKKRLEEKETNQVLRGSIQLYRDIQKTDLWKKGDGNLLKVYLYCLLRANVRENAVSKLELPEFRAWVSHAQFVTGRNAGGRRCYMSPTTYKKKLRELEKMGLIEQKITQNNRIITVKFLNEPFTS